MKTIPKDGDKLHNGTVSLNFDEADNKPCSRCNIIIPKIKGRENRRDCEDGKELYTYHLDCYDLEVLGHVTDYTKRKLRKLDANK